MLRYTLALAAMVLSTGSEFFLPPKLHAWFQGAAAALTVWWMMTVWIRLASIRILVSSELEHPTG